MLLVLLLVELETVLKEERSGQHSHSREDGVMVRLRRRRRRKQKKTKKKRRPLPSRCLRWTYPFIV
jgi:hypothetical protein